MSIEVCGVTKKFGSFTALRDVDLTIDTGELVALLGPSGSGKTTLLRIIAGLEFGDSGAIRFHGQDATDRTAKDRGVGFVFQHYALFRHMSVFENIAFGLRVKPRKSRPGNQAIREKTMELLRLVQLENLEKRSPSQLSGGQRQRVALARALAIEPKVLLLDEPFGALDAQVRLELRRWLRRLHDELHMTSVFVTHDQEEALEVADRVVVMNQGRIEQIGTPEEVYEKPANPFVYNFLGSVNLFHGRVKDGSARVGSLVVDAPGLGEEDSKAIAFVRPHELELTREPAGPSSIQVTVNHVTLIGAAVRVELQDRRSGDYLSAEIARDRYRDLDLKVGDLVYATPTSIRVFADRLDFSI